MPQRGDTDRVRVGWVVLAAVTGVEHPHPRRQLRRDVDHWLAVRDEALRELTTDTLRSLDRPPSRRPLLHERPQLPIAGRRVLDPQRRQHLLAVIEYLDG